MIRKGSSTYQLLEYLYDNDIWVDKRGNIQKDISSYEQVKEYYDNNIRRDTYNRARKILEELDIKFYDGYIELSDNHTLWQINSCITPEVYWMWVEDFAQIFYEETGVKVYCEGRSNRHVVVEGNIDNALQIDKLKEAQQRLEEEFINKCNNYKEEV